MVEKSGLPPSIGSWNHLNQLFLGRYGGKRVLITGNTGFKGSWLTLFALSMGAQVAGYSRDIPTQPSHFDACGVRDHIVHFWGDVRDENRLSRAFVEFRPEIVFHLAAQPIVRLSYENPKETFDTNIGGTVNVLECIRRSDSVKAVVMITSDKCYRNVEWDWGYRENDVLGGKDPYSASKACAELVCRSYFEAFLSRADAPGLATVRAGNVIGGGDWAVDRIIPDCVQAFLKKGPVLLRNPASVRPWQHVLEPLSGYLWLGALLLEAGTPLSGEAFNFGPLYDSNRTVQEVVEQFAARWKGARWETMDKEPEVRLEAGLLHLNCDKALRHLRWHGVLPMKDTVNLTADWYQAFYEGKADMFGFSQRQIQAYTDMAFGQGLAWTGAA